MGEHMHPEVSMHTCPLGDYMVHIRSGDGDGVADLMIASAQKPVSIGAELLICPDYTIIFGQLENGIFTEESRIYFNTVIENLRERDCDTVVLGCTEIPLLVDPDDCPLPVLDSTRLLARAVLKMALE